MRLFRRRSPVGMRPALGRGGAPIGAWTGDHPAQVAQAFAGNAVAQRAVRLVVEGCVAAPLYATGGARGDSAVALVGQAMEAAALHLLLHGNAFCQIGCDAGGEPAALWPLRPERVTIEPDATGWPFAYRYRAGEVTSRIPALDEAGRPGVIHVKGLAPADDHLGTGCLGAAMGAVAIHNAATRWSKALLDNAARPSGALVYDPGEPGAALTPEQYERLRAEMEASYAGAGNAGRPMLLEGGLKWQAMSLTPAELDFAGSKAAAAREIALAFGVPPMLLGLPGDSTHANYAEANRALWRLTILPLADKLVRGIVAALAEWWPDVGVAIDLDAIPALHADRERLWRSVTAAEFLSVDEKREMLGFGRRGDG